ncbi:hypothetical protein CYLTODRAFT_412458 [Cylindrobasidium torrendii FP15055 ss-10]|uniref:Uncharacterized protein n=1 Tax=Cylindrobasidium torrendii FP15055 ss-10 TaxID=1314674 RepID=A0A0D7B7Z1_9AGAR|nr:hypothetical protein CYLTODRAFT_412458 [Cylindrobasidium torrendii FP15055 ss-10]
MCKAEAWPTIVMVVGNSEILRGQSPTDLDRVGHYSISSLRNRIPFNPFTWNHTYRLANDVRHIQVCATQNVQVLHINSASLLVVSLDQPKHLLLTLRDTPAKLRARQFCWRIGPSTIHSHRHRCTDGKHSHTRTLSVSDYVSEAGMEGDLEEVDEEARQEGKDFGQEK